MIVFAAFVGGYILSHQNLKLPPWVPVLGKSYFTLKGDFQTAQAVAPGQGQAVTIAGAKIGEIASVDLQQRGRGGDDAPDPEVRAGPHLQERDDAAAPEDPAEGRDGRGQPGDALQRRARRAARRFPLSQTAPDGNFDEFLGALDAESRAYLQELLAGAGEGLKDNGQPLSAALKRFDPTARDFQEISSQLAVRHEEIASAIHNFRLLLEAVGGKDKQLAELVDSSNAVFKTFAEEDQSVESTIGLLPGALAKTKQGLGKLATAATVLGPTVKELQPFAKATRPGGDRHAGARRSRPRRSSRTRSARSRARSCPSSTRSGRPRRN